MTTEPTRCDNTDTGPCPQQAAATLAVHIGTRPDATIVTMMSLCISHLLTTLISNGTPPHKAAIIIGEIGQSIARDILDDQRRERSAERPPA